MTSTSAIPTSDTPNPAHETAASPSGRSSESSRPAIDPGHQVRQESAATDADPGNEARIMVAGSAVVCPFRLGDTVTVAGQPGLEGIVTGVFTEIGALECRIETVDRQRFAFRPWDLVPSGGASPQWRQQMRALRIAQHEVATDFLARHSNKTADRAEKVAHELLALAAALREGQIPEDDKDSPAFNIRALYVDDDLHNLRKWHKCLADLLSPRRRSRSRAKR